MNLLQLNLMQVEPYFILIINYKLRQDLYIYKSSELESTFVEIINPKKTNIIIGCICRHPTVNLNELNNNYPNIIAKNFKRKEKCFSSW